MAVQKPPNGFQLSGSTLQTNYIQSTYGFKNFGNAQCGVTDIKKSAPSPTRQIHAQRTAMAKIFPRPSAPHTVWTECAHYAHYLFCICCDVYFWSVVTCKLPNSSHAIFFLKNAQKCLRPSAQSSLPSVPCSTAS